MSGIYNGENGFELVADEGNIYISSLYKLFLEDLDGYKNKS